MKRTFLFILILLGSFSLFAQESVTISGKVITTIEQRIKLTVNSFDTVRMRGLGDRGYMGETLKAEVRPDSSYIIETDHIIRDYTPCILHFGTKKVKLLISPGDSLSIDMDYWFFETNLTIEGRGAEKNIYWTNPVRLSKKKEGERIVVNDRGESRLDKRNEMKEIELDFLDSTYTGGLIDSAFYQWDKKRIRYDCFDSNVRFSIWYNNNAKKHIDETTYYRSVKLQDDEALTTIESYRSLIKNYEKIHIASESSVSSGDILLMFSLGEKSFAGLTRTYFLWNVISSAVSDAVDKKEKQVIVDFAAEHVKDPGTQVLVQKLESNLYGGFVLGKSFSGEWATASFILGLIFLLAIVIILVLNLRSKKGRGHKPINFLSVRNFLIVVYLIFIIVIIGNGGGNDWISYIYLLLVTVFMIFHNRISLRMFAARGRYMLYSISTAILLISFFLAFYYLLKNDYKSFDQDDFYRDFLPIFIITSISMMLYAFAFYYSGIARKHKNGWNWLVEQKLLNIELIIHLIIISILFISIAASMSKPADLRTLFEVIIGLTIFYVTAYFLVNRYLLQKKFVQFFIYSNLILIGFALFITLLGGIFSYTGLHSRGVAITFFKALDFPSLDLFIFALPAVVFAWARKMYIDRERRGYSLYHQKEAEFSQLKAQVNPHFLFNSLNTVYAFALKEGNEKTAESIAKLANMMRYLIDDMEQDEIPIKKEIGYIEDYIKLQLIRSSVDHNIQLNFDLSAEQQNQMIAPMLMIPFVENAFKHGINPNASSNLKVKVSIVDGKFQFVIENSVDKNFEAFYKEKGFGIGIENIRKRLVHIYPDNHTLSIADTEDSFIVIMEIQMRSNK